MIRPEPGSQRMQVQFGAVVAGPAKGRQPVAEVDGACQRVRVWAWHHIKQIAQNCAVFACICSNLRYFKIMKGGNGSRLARGVTLMDYETINLLLQALQVAIALATLIATLMKA